MKGYRVDKTGWPDGEWSSEPDYFSFSHADIPCLIIRMKELGHLCGYVGVLQNHPWHGEDCDSIDAEAHGGLTYSRGAQWPVCLKEDSDNSWWVGFDCAHWMDRAPGTLKYSVRATETYRNMQYAVSETKDLAEQCAKALADKVLADNPPRIPGKRAINLNGDN